MSSSSPSPTFMSSPTSSNWKHLLKQSKSELLRQYDTDIEGGDTNYDDTPQHSSPKYLQCNNCASTNIIENTSQGIHACGQCGMISGKVIDDTIVYSSKTDAHAFAKDTSQCAPIDELLPLLSLSTKITPQYGSKNSYQEYRIARLNQWQAGDPIERALKVDFNYIDSFRYKHSTGFSRNILQTTKMLFKEYYTASYKDAKAIGTKRDCLRGKTRKGMIGYCIYLACKINNIHCTKEDIATRTHIDKLKIRKAAPIFLSTMKDKIVDIKSWNKNLSKISGVKDFIRKYQLALNLPWYITDYTYKLYKFFKPFRILNCKQPQSIAAVCIFFIVNELNTNITVENVLQKCEISKATINDVHDRVQYLLSKALITVFVPDVCHKLGIDNTISIKKITHICRMIDDIKSKFNNSIKLTIACGICFTIITHQIYQQVKLTDIANCCNVDTCNIKSLIHDVSKYREAIAKKLPMLFKK